MKETIQFDLFECIQTDLDNLHHSVRQLAKQAEDNLDEWSTIRSLARKGGIGLDIIKEEWGDGTPRNVEVTVDLVALITQAVTQIPDGDLLQKWLQKNSGNGQRIVRFRPSPP